MNSKNSPVDPIGRLDQIETDLDDILSQRTPERVFDELSQGSWIYGAGNYGRRIAALLRAHDLPIQGFIDRQGSNLGELDGYPVFAPDEITSQAAQMGAFILGIHSAVNLDPILEFARSRPFKHVVLTADLPDLFGSAADNYWLTNRRFLKENFDYIRAGVGLYHDEKSVDTFLRLLRYRITGDSFEQPDHNLQEQYYPPDLPGFQNPITFVDGGAYDGDTYRNLIGCGVRLNHWIAFEPDAKTFELLQVQANSANCQVTVIPCGLSDERRLLSFSNDGSSASKITDNIGPDTVTIQCVALDSMIFNQKIDYIKLDVEGAELAALNGMKRTIAEHRPRLALSAYHRPGDLWELSQFAHTSIPDGQLCMRQHYRNGFETVIYMIPRQ